jgi:hypothetical protein
MVPTNASSQSRTGFITDNVAMVCGPTLAARSQTQSYLAFARRLIESCGHA